ncbi:MAG: hypothetical protein ACYSWR_07235 [Planctomycetota bacterium]|jgi:hypothetical protein
MAAPQTEIESQVIELLGKSFGRPCDGIPAKEVARAWEEFRKTLWPLRTSCIGEQENEPIAKAHEKPNAYVIPYTMAKAYIKAIAKAEQKVKAETEETVTKIKAEAEKRAIAHTKAIAKIKTETREKAKAEAEEAIAKLKEKSEAEAAETIAKVKAEAEELRAEAKRLKAEAEKKSSRLLLLKMPQKKNISYPHRRKPYLQPALAHLWRCAQKILCKKISSGAVRKTAFSTLLQRYSNTKPTI